MKSVKKRSRHTSLTSMKNDTTCISPPSYTTYINEKKTSFKSMKTDSTCISPTSVSYSSQNLDNAFRQLNNTSTVNLESKVNVKIHLYVYM